VKFLLDQNLSYKLVADLQTLYPGTSQVRLLGMQRADDGTIWEHAKRHGFIIVTQDSDFHELSVLYGHPPKVIWLKCGNAPKDTIRRILIGNVDAIRRFHEDSQHSCLEIYSD
jgi:Uncharacterized protein conserved in bacteria